MLIIQFYVDNQIRVIEMVGPVAFIGGMTNAYKVLVGKSEGERPYGR
jgi:Cu/Ag efflux pump CusA